MFRRTVSLVLPTETLIEANYGAGFPLHVEREVVLVPLKLIRDICELVST